MSELKRSASGKRSEGRRSEQSHNWHSRQRREHQRERLIAMSIAMGMLPRMVVSMGDLSKTIGQIRIR